MREQGFAESEIRGLLAYEELFERCRLALRHGRGGDTWRGPSPNRDEIERMLGDDELISLVFEDSIAAVLDRYVSDDRIKDAKFGQGVIGTFAGPRDPGTASIKLMHHQGDLLGLGSVWGYVKGGMGRISFAIADAAREAGATLAAGVAVSRIVPGEGVEVESGELIRAPVVVCNADPKRMLAMLEGSDALPGDYRERLEAWDVDSPVVKLNVALERMPTFTAAEGTGVEPHRAMVAISPGLDAAQEAVEAARRGEPVIGFADLYFQTAYDDSVAPPGREAMSVFAQFVPYELAEGDWDSRRDEIGGLVLDEIAAHAPDIHDCVAEVQVLGPPDIEERIGLSGGHIFQGQALPDQMWDRRLEAETPVDGVYLCGGGDAPRGLGDSAQRSDRGDAGARARRGPGMTARRRLPPGPRMPAAAQTLAWWSRSIPFMERCRARFGRRWTLRLVGSPPFVMISDPDQIRELFTAPAEVLHPGEGAAILGPIVGERSVLLLDEGEHLEQRRLMLPAFGGERMERLHDLVAEVSRA